MQFVSEQRAGNKNAILAALSNQEYQHLQPHLETVNLPPKQNLYNCGDALEYVYFPLNAVVYLFTTMEDGATIESGVIGSEGVLGISGVFGVKNTSSQALTLSGNKALRIRTEPLKREFDAGGKLHNLFALFSRALRADFADRRL